jgi:hypothetical protein
MLQTNLYDATELKAIETRELGDSEFGPNGYLIGSVFVNVYAVSDVWLAEDAQRHEAGYIELTRQVDQEDAESVAEQLRETYGGKGFKIDIEDIPGGDYIL